ncbi:ATP-binding protein [Lentisphaera profundi]|uniref:histidine kinase n=1 Tax=Lentisphaera profundi TaxID=1658616 RepID=A0ABY7VVU9_9BACT|nr:ATP-binding protein [Lentisphaera profundi]WDE97017.1 ATP-binding protein [Lentisphaera profundi]
MSNHFTEMLPALSLCFLELTFLAVLIISMHSLRKVIGLTSYYMVVSFILVFAQLINAADISLSYEFLDIQMNVSSALLLTTFMTSLLITYTLDGPIAAQRLTVAAVVVSGSFYLLNTISQTQTQWFGFIVDTDKRQFYFDFFEKIRINTAASLGAIIADLLVLPVVFQIFKNRNFGTYFSVVISFLLTQVVDTYVYSLISNYHSDQFWLKMNQLFISRAFIIIWLSVIVTIYLRLNEYGKKEDEERNPMDFLRAVLSTYSYGNLITQHSRDWEGRFALFVENSPDLIFLVNSKGFPTDVNKRLITRTGHPFNQLQETHMNETLLDRDRCSDDAFEDILEKRLSFEDIWQGTKNMPDMRDFNFEAIIKTSENEFISVDFIASILYAGKTKLILMTGRETTSRHKLTHQRDQLTNQVSHLQRLESVGRLAGGVAHDFNNLLHSIQGSLDSFDNKSTASEKERVVGNIRYAVGRASDLTSKLLSFAKKGNFELKKLKIEDVLNSSWELFKPSCAQKIKIKLLNAPDPIYIRGDRTQLEQMILNLLINARDALEDQASAKITIRCEIAYEDMPGWEHAADELRADNYCCVRVKDNGTGIPQEVIEQVFEPFFTTKPIGKGTGMGLSMVYGTAASHNGWLHLKSEVDKGTEFFIFLPLYNAPSQENITRYDMDIENVQTLHRPS